MKEGKGGSKSFIIDVSPINKNSSALPLSYFSLEKIPVGTLVNIPLRSGRVLGVVVRSKSALSAKSDIRKAGFMLKKISKRDVLKAAISPEMIAALEKAQEFYASSIGSILSLLMTKGISHDPESFLPIFEGRKKKLILDHRENFMLQMEPEERFGQYRALIRQSFARGQSVLLVCPTHFDAFKAAEELSLGIKEFVHTFILKDGPAQSKKNWLKALREPHPILFITTPSGILFNRPDLSTIILERENSRSYHSLEKPYLSFKKFLEIYSYESKKQLISGDSVLSLESLWKEKNGKFGEASLIRWRLSGAPTKVVDATSAQDESGKFEIFSPELKSFILNALEDSGSIFLFGARKGLAPTTVCGDCGEVLPCLNCGAPIVLHDVKGAPLYICHACGSRRDSTTVCGKCRSWKLVPLGIGTEEIFRRVKAMFPSLPVHILDKEYASTDKQAEIISRKFEETGGILVGTELAFFHLKKAPYSAVVSLDSLFSIPDFGINERIFYIVSRLREMTQNQSLIQTRNIGKQILAWSAQGSISDFYQNEISEREMLIYPPFSVFIKIEGKDRLKLEEQFKEFAKWRPDIVKHSLIIRLSRQNWPDPELSQKLSLLSREFSIKVDPESIL